jgi:hypothetical protein
MRWLLIMISVSGCTITTPLTDRMDDFFADSPSFTTVIVPGPGYAPAYPSYHDTTDEPFLDGR